MSFLDLITFSERLYLWLFLLLIHVVQKDITKQSEYLSIEINCVSWILQNVSCDSSSQNIIIAMICG